MLLRSSITLLIIGSLTFSSPWRWVAVGVLLVLAVSSVRREDAAAAVIAVLGVVVVGTASGYTMSVWIAAAVAGVVWWRAPSLRRHLGPVRAGDVDRAAAVVAGVTVVVAAAALAVWTTLQLDAGLDETSSVERFVDLVERLPLWPFLFGALAFAVLNAVAEEFVYRGILFHALLPFGASLAVLLQAAAFGAIHLHGFPSGWWGVAMATVYGVALGWLRLRTDGLLAPTAVHVSADVVIAFLVRFAIA